MDAPLPTPRASWLDAPRESSWTTLASSRRPTPLLDSARVPLRAIVTSPLRRCRQTAQALQAGRAESCPILVEKGLVECGYGEWTGRSLRDLSKDKLWHSVQHQPSAVRFPGGESMTEMSSRAVGAIRSWDRRMAADHGEDVIWAAVSHGDVIKAILADALGMHLDSFQRLMVDPASDLGGALHPDAAVRGHGQLRRR